MPSPEPDGLDSAWRPLPTLPPLSFGTIHVWRLLQKNQPAPDQARALLSGPELARAASFLFDKDRLPWMAARATLRLLLAHYAGTSVRDVPLATETQGKPFLPGSDVRFNLSHTEGVALIAVARQIELGIDVERVSAGEENIAGLAEVARQHFAPREQEALAQYAARDQAAAFVRCWTRKEALLKAEGCGLFRALDTFTVSLEADAPVRVLAGAPGWSLAHLAVQGQGEPGEALGALAWATQSTSPCIEQFDWTPTLLRL